MRTGAVWDPIRSARSRGPPGRGRGTKVATSRTAVVLTTSRSCYKASLFEKGVCANQDMTQFFPLWTLLPFATLVLGIASLPLLFPNAWGKHGFQAFVALGTNNIKTLESSRSDLTKVLQYHVVVGRVSPGQLATGKDLTTLIGVPLRPVRMVRKRDAMRSFDFW